MIGISGHSSRIAWASCAPVMLIGIGAYMLLSTDVVLGLLALSFVPFVGWRSSVTQLRLRATWLDLQQRLSVLTRIMLIVEHS